MIYQLFYNRDWYKIFTSIFKNNQPNIEYVKSTETTLFYFDSCLWELKTNFRIYLLTYILLGDIGYDFSDSIKVSMESNTEFVKYVNSN